MKSLEVLFQNEIIQLRGIRSLKALNSLSMVIEQFIKTYYYLSN